MPVRNVPLQDYSEDYGYRYRNIAPGEMNSEGLLLVLTFSGGGTRAAALSYGVMRVLRDTQICWEGETRSLLCEADIISSTSGGSLTAAYYGLFGDRIFEDFTERVLYQNIQGTLIRSVLSPPNLVKLLSPFYGRTDLLAENMNRRIFDEKTYGDLLARNRRPYIIINTTDMSRGSRIGFTQGMFDLFYSDLSAYPVGNAVAASAAFPGLLDPMTIQNFPKPEDFEPPPWAVADSAAAGGLGLDDPLHYLGDARPYIHVVDGGVADNLGLLPVIMGLDGHYLDDDIGGGAGESLPQKVVIVTVNAEGSSRQSWDLKAGLPGLLDTLLASGTAPIGNFSRAQIAYLRRQIAYRESLREIKEEVAKQAADQGVSIQVPALDLPATDIHFIEVAFNQLECPEERAYLSRIPTSFHLPRESVDRIITSAAAILSVNPDFKALIEEIQPPEIPTH